MPTLRSRRFEGHRRIRAIAAASGFAPATVLRAAALRDHSKLDRPPEADQLELLPIFERSDPESWSIKMGSTLHSDRLTRSTT
ncbi:hypothetical protein CDQ92_07920 [Sphingopyxis bauzanensis]|uniref:Uncharacterized protein n=2 Tax=Sphingopyxis bauzanensis TaxID=651663 RepID=A0A246JVB8_9SPHN|nr:hypothetical protein [Sphingopyxis bauzanensis]OWQ97010.1 hypothetical protein CDQ92_07920 [Sphingopyxis bauzanensis]